MATRYHSMPCNRAFCSVNHPPSHDCNHTLTHTTNQQPTPNPHKISNNNTRLHHPCSLPRPYPRSHPYPQSATSMRSTCEKLNGWPTHSDAWARWHGWYLLPSHCHCLATKRKRWAPEENFPPATKSLKHSRNPRMNAKRRSFHSQRGVLIGGSMDSEGLGKAPRK